MEKDTDDLEQCSDCPISPLFTLKRTTSFPMFDLCDYHKNQVISASCCKCEQPVCMKCIIESHNGHQLEDITEVHEKFQKLLQKKVQNIEEDLLSKLSNDVESVKSEVKKRLAKNEEIKLKIGQQQELINGKSRTEKEDLLTELDSNIADLKETQNDLQKRHETVQKHVDSILNCLESGSTIELIKLYNQTKELYATKEEYLEDLGFTEIEDIQIDLRDIHGMSLIGKLRYVRNMPELKIKQKYWTDLVTISSLIKMNDTEMWAGDLNSQHIIRLQKEGSRRAARHKLGRPQVYSFAVTKNGSVLVTFESSRDIYQTHSDGSQSVFTRVTDLFPLGLEVARNGDVYACCSDGYSRVSTAHSTSRKGFLRIACNGQLLNFFNPNKTGKTILRSPTYVTENTDGTICIIDRQTYTECTSGRVVAFDNAGVVRFIYRGPSHGISCLRHHDMKYISRDQKGRILVSVFAAHEIHMIDGNGDFLGYVLRSDNALGIMNPSAIHVDDEGFLWMGCKLPHPQDDKGQSQSLVVINAGALVAERKVSDD